MIAIIPCSAAKLDRPAPAGELYLGSLHRLARRAADALDARTLILSGRYGLVPTWQTLDPYEQRIDAPGAISAEQLAEQLDYLIPAGEIVWTMLPSAYRTALAAAGLVPTVDVLAGSRGIGEQRGRLSAIARGELEVTR